MAVKISGLKPTISVPATLYLPVDGGQFAAHQFSVEFKRLPKSRRDEINELVVVGKKSTGADGAEEVKRLTIPELLDEVVVGWGGMTGEDGSPCLTATKSAGPRKRCTRVWSRPWPWCGSTA